MQPVESSHRKYYLLALPLLATLGGVYLALDMLFGTNGEVLVFAASVAVLFFLFFEIAFSATVWLEQEEKRGSKKKEAEEESW